MEFCHLFPLRDQAAPAVRIDRLGCKPENGCVLRLLQLGIFKGKEIYLFKGTVSPD
jgi:Fe2+ transport system protein FeoA